MRTLSNRRGEAILLTLAVVFIIVGGRMVILTGLIIITGLILYLSQ